MSARPPQSSSPPPIRPPHAPPPPRRPRRPPPPPDDWYWQYTLTPPPHESPTLMILSCTIPFIAIFIVISLVAYYKRANPAAGDRASGNAVGATPATVASRAQGKGLSVEAIAALPTFEFRSGGGGGGGGECSICLMSVGEGEMVRALPQCMHLFHVDCIDQWFGSHKTCPCCRAEAELAGPSADV